MDQPSSTESNAITLRIRFKSASLDEFIGRYGADVSPGGIFIRTKQPVEVGTSLQFDFSLADGSSLLSGLGTVAWVRESDPARANSVPGMGLRFDKLTPESQHTHQMILAEKARKEGKAPARRIRRLLSWRPHRDRRPFRRHPKRCRATADSPGTRAREVRGRRPASFAKTLPSSARRADRAHQEAPECVGAVLPRRLGEPDGKTEISDKPIDYYMKEAEAAQAKAAPTTAAVPESAPKSDIEEWKTDAHTEEGLDAAPPAPEEVALLDSQSYSAEVPSSEIPVSPAAIKDSGERRPSDKDFFTSMLDMGDTTREPGRQTARCDRSHRGRLGRAQSRKPPGEDRGVLPGTHQDRRGRAGEPR